MSFAAIEVLPGDAAYALLGAGSSELEISNIEAQLQLDRPIFTRYAEWLGAALQGDLGYSLISRQRVDSIVFARLAVTAELVALTLIGALAFAIVAGFLAARKPRGIADNIGSVVSMLGLSLPSYVMAIVLVYVFAVSAKLFPALGFSALERGILSHFHYLVLPAVALGFSYFCLYSRFLRGDLIEQMESEGYIFTAKAKGLSRDAVLFRHALRNSLIGLVSVVGINFPSMLGGTVIVEQLFSLPGIGQLLLQAVNTRDAPLLQGAVVIIAVITVCGTLVADILQAMLDPRIRYGSD